MKQDTPLARTQMTMPSVGEFFSPTGVLAHAGGLRFEYRPGQLQMALRVEKALIEGTHLVVEAGTGTGVAILLTSRILSIYYQYLILVNDPTLSG